MSDRLETVKDVAERLAVSEKFVRRHALDLGAVRVGSHLRFTRSGVDAYLASRSLSPKGKT